MDERRKEGVERARKGGSGGSRQGEREREREKIKHDGGERWDTASEQWQTDLQIN